MFFFIIKNKLDKKPTLEITVGYQSSTAVTWGGVIMDEYVVLEENLQLAFPDYDIQINWLDSKSGMPLINGLINGSVDFAFVGDVPALLSKNMKNNKFDPMLLAVDGHGKNGVGQAVFVNNADKKIASTAYSSSAEKVLFNALSDKKMTDKFDIVYQDLGLALQYFLNGDIKMISVWEPYVSYLSMNRQFDMFFSGEETNLDYLSAVVVNKKENRDIDQDLLYSVFIKSLNESHEIINKDPNIVDYLSEKTGFPKKVVAATLENISFSETDVKNYYQTFIKLREELIDEGRIEEKYKRGG